MKKLMSVKRLFVFTYCLPAFLFGFLNNSLNPFWVKGIFLSGSKNVCIKVEEKI